MKKYFGLLALSLALPAAAQAKALEVNVNGDSGKVEIRFTTVATHSSMCFMANRKLNIDLGRLSFTEEEVTNGKIELKAERNPRAMCLMAFGPHRGGLTLEKGESLPQLPNGKYKLSINGENYGTLTVTENDAVLE